MKTDNAEVVGAMAQAEGLATAWIHANYHLLTDAVGHQLVVHAYVQGYCQGRMDQCDEFATTIEEVEANEPASDNPAAGARPDSDARGIH